MDVLKATEQQYESLNGYRKGSSVLGFIKDNNNNWVVNTAVLSDPAFIEIESQLQELEIIQFEEYID